MFADYKTFWWNFLWYCMAKSEQEGTAKKVFIVGLDHMVQKIVSKDFDIKTYHLLFCATLSRSHGFFKSWWTQSSGLWIEDCFRQSSELGGTTTPPTIWRGCWHWWHHTDTSRGYEKCITYIIRLSGKNKSKLPGRSKNGLRWIREGRLVRTAFG